MMGIASLLFGIAGMVLVWFPESGPLSLVLPLLALGFGGAEAFRRRNLALPVAAGIVLGLLALLLLAFFYWTPPENDEPVPLSPPTTGADRAAPAELPQTVPAPRRGLPGPGAPVPGIGGWLPAWPSPLQPMAPVVRVVPATPASPATPVAPDAVAEPPSPEIPAEEMEEPVPAEQAVAPVSLPEPGIAPALPSSSSEASPSLPPQVFAPPSTAASPPGRRERSANTYSLPAEMLPANATSLPAEMLPANATSLPAEMKPANATSLPATLIPR